MSDLPGNPYLRGAFSLDCTVEDWMTDEGVTDATMLATVIDRQAEATLALAFEQRTANLIAVAVAQDQRGVVGDRYWEEVAERLGLGGEES